MARTLDSGAVTEAQTERPGLDLQALAALIELQHGVVARRQLVELGAQEWDVRRLLRRQELHQVHAGVYVNQTGTLSRAQREWVAVLTHWPAALTLESVLPGVRDDDVIHVAIAHGRSLRPIDGVRLHRTARLTERVRWNASPPAMRIEDAAVSVADSQVDQLAAFETLAKVVRSRGTTVQRLRAEVDSRPRLGGRPLLIACLEDLASGACSVLEREWLRVERCHGLPAADRQQAAVAAERQAYIDASYADLGVRVELDGQEFHAATSAAWDSDHERDLEAISRSDEITLRLTYGQVFRRGCETAASVAAVLRRRGWDGTFVRCPRCAPSP